VCESLLVLQTVITTMMITPTDLILVALLATLWSGVVFSYVTYRVTVKFHA